MEGKLIIVSAPSGSGKTTLVKYLIDQRLNLAFSISACTRSKRPFETDGKDYYFISKDDFKSRVESEEFIEWEEVYPGQFYGTLKSEIERVWSEGKHVIFDIDVIGALNIKRQFGSKALSLFIMPPSITELENRLRRRSTESSSTISERVAKAEAELKYANKFDTTIINENLKQAKSEILNKVSEFLNG